MRMAWISSIHPQKLTWIPTMMVWKRWTPLTYVHVWYQFVRFLGCTFWHKRLMYHEAWCLILSVGQDISIWPHWPDDTSGDESGYHLQFLIQTDMEPPKKLVMCRVHVNYFSRHLSQRYDAIKVLKWSSRAIAGWRSSCLSKHHSYPKVFTPKRSKLGFSGVASYQ